MRGHGTRRGSVLILVVAVGIVITATVWSGLSILATETTASIQEEAGDQARAIAEAGLQWAVWKLDKDPQYAGEKGKAVGSGAFDVQVEAREGRLPTRRVRVVGRCVRPGLSTASAAFAGVLMREDAPGGPVWRRLSWRVDSSAR